MYPAFTDASGRMYRLEGSIFYKQKVRKAYSMESYGWRALRIQVQAAPQEQWHTARVDVTQTQTFVHMCVSLLLRCRRQNEIHHLGGLKGAPQLTLERNSRGLRPCKLLTEFILCRV